MAAVSSHDFNGERESNGGGRGIRRQFLPRGEETARCRAARARCDGGIVA
jgi:hypothetical protein